MESLPFVLVCCVCPVLLLTAAGNTSAQAFTFETSLAKIHPDTTYTGSETIHVSAARNEYESFQVIISGPAQQVHPVSISFTGPGNLSPDTNVLFYREDYVTVTTPSNAEGAEGRWPDPLIPGTDSFFHEVRSAFPFDVPAGENRVIWVDLFIPPETTPGEYTGRLTISIDGSQQSADFSLTVWSFLLPSTSSLPTAFGFDGWEVLRGHYGSEDMHNYYNMIVPLTQMYLDSALMNRVTLSSFLKEDWDFYSEEPDWLTIHERWRSYFEGRTLPFGIRGAKVTTIRIPESGDTDEERVRFWQDVCSHFREWGCFDKLFDYTFDEPDGTAEDYDAITHRASLVHQADPELRVLVTTDIQEAAPFHMEDIIDIWVPLINFMDGKPYDICWQEQYAGNHRADYDTLIQGGAELWWYQSCMSHGCGDPPEDPCYMGWPSYMVDHSAVKNRIMSWLTYRYDIGGELYFAVNYADEEGDAWDSVFYFDGNGDGTLFYPGRPSNIGGSTHIPIESIRLKHIRDGLEDYEYFRLVEQTAGRDKALSFQSGVADRTFEFTSDPAVLLEARRRMGAFLSSSPDESIEVTLTMPAHAFSPGDTCSLSVTVHNGTSASLPDNPLFVILELAGMFWFAPSWVSADTGIDAYHQTFPPGDTSLEVIPAFQWPDGAGSFSGARFIAALTDPDVTRIIGSYDVWTWDWHE